MRNGILAGLSAIIIFTATVLISITFKTPYDFGNQYFSELGTGSYGYIFNSGLIITALLLLVFFYHFIKIDNFLSKLGAVFGFISCLFLIGVAVFTGGHPYHVTTTTLFFSFVLMASLFISLSVKSIFVKLYQFFMIILTFTFSYIYYIGNESQVLQKVVIICYFIWIIIVSIKSKNSIEEIPTRL